jgi:hypothetical protein
MGDILGTIQEGGPLNSAKIHPRPSPLSQWKTINSRMLHQTPWLTLYENDVIQPNGKPGAIHNPNLATIFVAKELSKTDKDLVDEDGIADVLSVTWADIDRMIQHGGLTDSKAIAALFLFERHRQAVEV